MLVGDLSLEQARQLSKQLLAGLPSGDLPSLEAGAKTFEAQSGVAHIHFPATQTAVVIGQQGVARSDPDFFPLLVGNHILGGSGMNSRLFQTVREQKGLTYYIGSRFATLLSPGPFMISFATRNSQAEQALSATHQVLAQFLKESVTDEELASAKQYLATSYVFGLASNAGMADTLAHMAWHHLPLDYLERYPEKIRAVTRAEIKQAFARHLDVEHMMTVMVGQDDSSQKQ